jgi:hypothetical protein
MVQSDDNTNTETVKGYATGGLVKNRTDSQINKSKTEIQRIDRIQRLDYRLLPQILQASETDIDQ